MASAGMFLLISWRWVVKVVAVIATTRIAATICTLTRPWLWMNVAEIGIVPNSFAFARLVACSVVMKPFAVWFFCAWSSRRNSAMKIGDCTNSGRHAANGLVPVAL